MRSEAGTGPKDKGPTTLPTGTVTFLFTDIEGSTRRWETHRDAMNAAVKRHDELLRSAIEAHHGTVFKTVGDAFCAVFARVSDAVAACVDAQRSLNAEDFSTVEGMRVRSALHTGEAVERDSDYFGPAVNRVARLMSTGHGGQVLMSSVTRDLAHNDLPSGTSLIDLGSQRLRDLGEPEHVWQLTFRDLPGQFPPLKSLDTLPNNLPIQRTTFVGREGDVAQLKELLGSHRLLTIVGSGGVGKTRLAMQAGADLLDCYPDGVWLADFASITDPELVSSVIARALGMSQQESRRVDESIPPWVKRKTLLLILDNCEHVLESVISIVDAILDTAPDVRIVSTSRQILGVHGEEVLRLSSLAVPKDAVGLTSLAVMPFGAVALFVDRAKSVDKSFALTDNNAAIVADICRRLDGIPLAIELAAARVKVLSIPHLAHRLNDRFKILTGGSRTALPRQKTLSALIDWSYDLLSKQEQMLFNRLGIFAGGFSLDAATAICKDEGIEEADVLDLLASLTDKSLIIAETGGAQERYHLLESVRAYALEKLGAEGKPLARRHAEYFCDQAIAADEHYGEGPTLEWLGTVEPELDNFRAALEWAITQGNDAALGGAFAGALGDLWLLGGLAVEGRWWVEACLERLESARHPGVAARLWRALASLTSQGSRRCEAAQRACDFYDKVDDRLGAARAAFELAFGYYQMGQTDEALIVIEQALEAARACDDKVNVASCLRRRAVILSNRGDTDKADEGLEQALTAFRVLGNDTGIASVLLALAENDFQRGENHLALRHGAEALAILSAGKHTVTLAMLQDNVAAYNVALGDLEEARHWARKCLETTRDIEESLHTAIALQHLATIAALRRNANVAARLKGFIDKTFRALPYERERTESWGNEKLIASLHEQLTEAEIEKLGVEGASWPEDRAIEEGLTI
jgi:predicted ATPase/class 3 adenylate cyclase